MPDPLARFATWRYDNVKLVQGAHSNGARIWYFRFGGDGERWNPAQSPDLLTRFANLRDDAYAYLRFAQECGPLGVSEWMEVPGARSPRAENLYAWATAAQEVRAVLELHQAATAETSKAAEKRVERKGDRWTVKPYTPRRTKVIGGRNVEIPEDGGPSYLLTPEPCAPDWPGQRVGTQASLSDVPFELPPAFWPILGGRDAPAGDLGTDARMGALALIAEWSRFRLAPATRTFLRAQRGQRQLGFQTVSLSLLGVLWHQLASHVAKGNVPRACKKCAKIFSLSERNRQGHGTFCSASCRVGWSQRKKRAKELWDKKKPRPTRRAIADKVGVPVDDVRVWVREFSVRDSVRTSLNRPKQDKTRGRDSAN